MRVFGLWVLLWSVYLRALGGFVGFLLCVKFGVRFLFSREVFLPVYFQGCLTLLIKLDYYLSKKNFDGVLPLWMRATDIFPD